MFSSHSFWTSSSLDVPAGVTQEEDHTRFLILLSAMRALSRGHTGGISYKISHPPFFCNACLNFSREKDSAIPLCTTNDLIVLHPLGIFFFF